MLVEREDGLGHAENFASVRVARGARVGGIVEAEIAGVEDGILIGATE